MFEQRASVAHRCVAALVLHRKSKTITSLIGLAMFELYRPSSTTNRTSPYVVYPSSLFCLDLGYALWYPEPHKTGEPQIGDVGYVKEGAFIRLFNINNSKPEHQVTFWKRPFDNTEPLSDSQDVFLLDERGAAVLDGSYLSRGVRERETRGSVTM